MNFLRAAVPVAIVIAVTWLITGILKSTKPEAKRKARPSQPPAVSVMKIEPVTHQVTIRTRGEVRARTRSVLIPEVSGRIVSVSPNFRDGGFFEKNEVLAQIDERDYETAVTVAAGNVAQAQNAHAQERARSAQAKENWERLGNGKEPSELVLRLPQLAEAAARVAAAEAQLVQAETDLERTKVRAPYAGRLREQLVDVGQFVTTGTSLARIFAVDYAEVRLPLTSQQASMIDLPESYRGSSDTEDEADAPEVVLTKKQGSQMFEWRGRVVRTEGAIDLDSRQLFVIAQVDDPYAKRDDGTPPLKVGDFIEASISGRKLEGIFKGPRTAIRQGQQALVIDADNRLRFRDLQIVWSERDHLIAAAGLKAGEAICTTPPAFATEGSLVTPIFPGEQPPSPNPKGRGKGKPE